VQLALLFSDAFGLTFLIKALGQSPIGNWIMQLTASLSGLKLEHSWVDNYHVVNDQHETKKTLLQNGSARVRFAARVALVANHP
jgi:hypothetical protein